MQIKKNMMKYLGVCTLGIASAAMLGSCSNIDEEDRYIPIEIHHSEKVVLVEEFTGNRCSNCPDAAKKIDDLHGIFGDNLITVSLHPYGSHFTEPLTKRVDLRSEVATTVYQRYTADAFPAAMIDRTPYKGKVILTNTEVWSAAVKAQAETITDADLHLALTYPAIDDDGKVMEGSFNVSYDVNFTSVVEDEVALQLWVIENGIVGPQLTTTGRENNYVHNHVLRAAINGNDGETLSLPEGATHWLPSMGCDGKYLYTPDEKWNMENLQVVGFIYRKSDGRVMQAALVDVHTPAASE